jgi:RNA polymerase sigma-70 factor (ECF subfamily)
MLPVLDSTPLADDDALLISAIQSGDRAALKRLYLGYQPRLARLLAQMTARSEDTEEIINDTFAVVWTDATAFRSQSLVSTWIFGIAYQLTMRSLKWQKMRLSQWSTGLLEAQCADPVPDTKMTNRLDYALGRLPVKQRITVTLAYQMGFGIEEISQITKTRTSTVRARMFQARLRLRELVEELGGAVHQPNLSGSLPKSQ